MTLWGGRRLCFSGLDLRGPARSLWALLEDLTATGTSLLLTAQYLEEADRLADAIVVLDTGRVIAAGTAAQLKAQVGGGRLELTALPGEDVRALAAELTEVGSGPAVLDEPAGRVVRPVTRWAGDPAGAGRPTRGQRPSDGRPGAAPAHPGRRVSRPDRPGTGRPCGQRCPGTGDPVIASALPTVPTSGPRWMLADVATITARNLCPLIRVPTLIAFATIQPIMFVLLFNYAFGGAIHPPGVTRYIDFLLPGLVVLAIAFGAAETGVAIVDDLATEPFPTSGSGGG